MLQVKIFKVIVGNTDNGNITTTGAQKKPLQMITPKSNVSRSGVVLREPSQLTANIRISWRSVLVDPVLRGPRPSHRTGAFKRSCLVTWTLIGREGLTSKTKFYTLYRRRQEPKRLCPLQMEELALNRETKAIKQEPLKPNICRNLLPLKR